MTIYRGPGGTGETTTDTDLTEMRQIALEAEGYRDEALAAALIAQEADSQAAASAAAASAAADRAEEARDAILGAEEIVLEALADVEAARDVALAAADDAQASADEAALSASDAASSAEAALLSETNAAASEAAAALSAAAALVSEQAAAASEAAALASEQAAALSETNAANSASSAADDADATAADRAAVADLYDDFDDRYLGPKATNPTTDNDGDPLIEGAMYWNTTDKEFRFYNGTGWAFLSGLPSQVGKAGKFLMTDGSTPSWEEVPDPQPATPTDDGLVYGSTPTDTVEVYEGWPASYTVIAPNIGGYWTHINSSNVQDVRPGSSSVLAGLVAVADTGDPVYVAYNGTTYYLGTYISGGVTALPGGGIWVEFSYDNTGGSGFTSTVNIATYVFSSPSSSSGGNTSLGYDSNNDNGSQNTAIGYEAGNTITTGTNLTVIGYGAQPSSATATNEVTIGNADVTKTRIWGALAVNDSTGTTGQVLTSNGSGTPTWQTPATAPVTSVNGETGAVVLDAADVGAATTAQGALADSAVQPGDNISTLTNDAGYITGYTETDPIYVASSWYTTTNNSGNWDTAYGWGNHASVGYAVYPSQTGNSGKFLTTDGTNTSWANVDALPSQTGNAGKYLTTDGSIASWATLNTDGNITTKGLYENASVISANYTIGTGNNAMSAGPITVDSGVSVTVPSGSVWSII